MGELPEGCLLATMDVTSLYTNIPHDEGTAACKKFYLKHCKDNVVSENLAHAINFILTHNFFTFNDKYYLQIKGTAMGTKMAPSYANIFMDELETKMLSSFPLKPLLYLRYIDDIFIIWDHGKDALKSFEAHVNSFHTSIKFTLEVSPKQVSFLDVLVQLNDNQLSTSVYYKPTDNHMYLDFNSFHPSSLKKSIVYSQCLRLKRICSDHEDYINQTSRLSEFFFSAGYPVSIIKNGIKRAAKFRRDDLLIQKEVVPKKRIPFVTQYHPLIKKFSPTLRKEFTSQLKDPSLTDLFKDPPIIAMRQPPNLHRLLTSSKLPTSCSSKTGNLPCNKPRCQICKHITTGISVKLPNLKTPLNPPNLNCDSKNVIYIIHCTACSNGTYVGETGTPFRLRFNNHKKSIRDNFPGFPIAEHFNLPLHSLLNLRCTLIASNFISTADRKRKELNWIIRLKTHVHGLNKDLGVLSNYSSLH